MTRILTILALALVGCGQDDPPGEGASGGSSSGSDSGSSEAGAATSSEGGAAPIAPGGKSGAPGDDAGAPNASGGSTTGGSAGADGSAGSGGALGYLPCESKADCDAFGGGKVCCAAGSMHFCTKPSACPGDTLP
ncbi:MAG TPA: hypothetical protein VEX18_22030 [Polyangiaceae bacterium]|nr:hypothetical protein [Polyangiaceae bacterium]